MSKSSVGQRRWRAYLAANRSTAAPPRPSAANIRRAAVAAANRAAGREPDAEPVTARGQPPSP